MCRIAPMLMVCVCLVLLMGAPRAAELGDLYTAEAPVLDDSPEQRSQGFADALTQVMVRLSGDVKVNNHPGAAALLAKAPSLVQQFRYRLTQANKANSEGEAEALQKRYLWAKFDAQALDRLMREAGIPVWGKQRPRVLLWLAVERNGKRYLFDLESDPASRNELRQHADRRGLPLQLALVDLQDQAQLSAADVWADYATAIRKASERYPHDVVLTGRLRHLSGDKWSATWTLFDAGGNASFQGHDMGWSALLHLGIHSTQDRLAAKYAPTSRAQGSGSDSLVVRFTHIDSLSAYGRLQKILKAQDGLVRYAIKQVEDNEFLLEIWFHGGPSALSRGFALSGELSAVKDALNPEELVFSLSHGSLE